MKVVILAGGFGTRLSEETVLKPKPMVEIGGKPIMWHIMKLYSEYGFNDFVICCGYKGYYIKEYFANYFFHQSDVTFDFKNGQMKHTVHSHKTEPWSVTLVDTGLDTMTGGRVKRIKEYIGNETFMLTYGDGVSNVDIKSLYEFHKKNGKKATVTSVQPYGRFGSLEIDESGKVGAFREKSQDDVAWINGGFFVLEPSVFDYIDTDQTIFEREPLEQLTRDGELVAYKHTGFWKPMDTLRDKHSLEDMWDKNEAEWKVWE